MFNKSIPIVMYHHVSPPGKELNVQPKIFQDHLSILCSEGWKTLSGEEFLYFLQNNEIPKKCVLLTFDDGFTERRSEVMCTWQELKEMEGSGIFDIQSHGHSHNTPQYLKEKKYAELKEDLFASKKILEKRLSKHILHFCWPRGKYNQTGVDIAAEAGFRAIYTTERGANTKEDLKALKRLPVKKNGKWLVNRLNIYSSVLFSKFYLGVRTVL